MTLLNYDKSMNFCESVKAFAIILQSCLLKLNDEADFRDDEDSKSLHAAYFFLHMLEDAQKVVSEASARLEKKLMQLRN